MIKLTLKRGKEESLGRRHPWVFSGAIAQSSGTPQEGDVVDVLASDGRFIARGHCGVGSIVVRVLTFDESQSIDADFWSERIREAFKVRETLGLVDNPETTCCRLVYGEGDGLPGLVIDVYGTAAVMQAHSVGMYLAREQIAEALKEVYGNKLTTVYDKSAGTIPPKSGIEAKNGYLYGGSADASREILEHGNKFETNWEEGQKTGFFLDQRESRELVGRYAEGRRVLNTFCYTGGFSVYALRAGAQCVDSVDSSARAVELANRNVVLNFGENIAGEKHRGIVSDTMDFLRDGVEAGQYDLVILDPPAYAKHHKSLGNALQGYKRLNARAMEKIAKGGLLFTFSCSQAVNKEQFRTAVFSAAAIAGRNVRILHQLNQPADHPVSIYHPEGEYLKGLLLYIE